MKKIILSIVLIMILCGIITSCEHPGDDDMIFIELDTTNVLCDN